MAGQIKGITIVFDGETTKLDQALNKIKGESKSVDQQLKEVNRSLRFNPRNVELLRQKFTLLGQKVDSTEKELKQLRDAERQLKAQNVSKESAEWMKVRRSIVEAESKLKHFKAEQNKLKYARVTAMGQAFKSAGQNMRTAGTYATIASGAMVVAGKKLLDLNRTQEEAETKLTEIYKSRLGVDAKRAKQTMKVASALQKEGVIGDEITLSGAQQIATFTKQADTVDKLLPAMDNLLVQQKGYSATADDAKNIANLFGKAMMGQTGALKRVGITFTDAQEKVLKYGTEEEKAAMLSQVITDNVGNMNKAFAETDEGKMAQLKNTLGDMGERLGHALLPALGQMATWISDNIMPKVEQLIAFIEAHPIIAKIAVGLTALLAVMGPLLIIVGALISAVGTIMGAIGGLSSAFAFLTGPIGLVIAGIAAAIAIGILLYKNWDKIKAWAIKTWTAIKTAITTRVNAIKTGVSNAFNTMKAKIVAIWNSLKGIASTVFKAIANAMLAPIRGVVGVIRAIVNKIKGFFKFKVPTPHIPLPHFAISPKGWKLGDLLKGKKPSLSIDWYATGGIFSKPTIAGIGESGPEAVVPLDKLWKAIESSGGDNVVINVYASDGMSVTALAKEVERRLIDSQKRRRMAWQ